MGAAQYYYAHVPSEPFPELSILGPSQKIGGYPTDVVAGQNFTLYLYVGNHEGHVEYFNVLIKLGNNASVVNGTNGMNAPVFATYRMILANNQSLVEPITLSLPTPGQNVRMVFELWAYNVSTNAFTYTYVYNQLWVNVTAVA